MKTFKLPYFDVNSESATLIKWLVNEKAFVQKGEIICEIETTKSVIEVESEFDGFIMLRKSKDDEIKFGEVIAYFFDTIEKYEKFFDKNKDKIIEKGEDFKATKKAIQLMQQYNIKPEEVQSNGIVTEKDVLAIIEKNNLETEKKVVIVEPGILPQGNKKVLIIGAGLGAMQVIDILLNTYDVEIIGLVDDNNEMFNKNIFGYRVIGKSDDIIPLFKEGRFTHAIISVSTSIGFRDKMFKLLKENNIPLVNAICPSVRINRNVVIGEGNVICSNVHIGTCTTIGDNNFISSNSSIEHHNIIGNNNTFGPSINTSSRVIIGNNNKFGMGINIQPGISVEDNCFIASGSVLIQSIPSFSSVKIEYNQKIIKNNKN